MSIKESHIQSYYITTVWLYIINGGSQFFLIITTTAFSLTARFPNKFGLAGFLFVQNATTFKTFEFNPDMPGKLVWTADRLKIMRHDLPGRYFTSGCPSAKPTLWDGVFLTRHQPKQNWHE